jgi:apolipoprotein N-acyltransferase
VPTWLRRLAAPVTAIRRVLRSREDRRDAALAIAAGCCCFLSFPRFDVEPLGWVCLAPLLWAVRGAAPRRAFLLGWLMGFVTNAGGFHWVTGLLVRFGHMPLALAVPLCGLLALYQGLVFATTAGVSCWAAARGAPLVLAVPAALVVAEWLIPFLFPWYLANGQYRFITFIQGAELGGVLLLTGAMAAFAAGLVRLVESRLAGAARLRAWEPVAAFLPAAALLVFGAVREGQVVRAMAATPPVAFGVVQANIGIEEKSSDRSENLRLHREMTRDLKARGAEVVVWPETASGAFFPADPGAPGFARTLERVAGDLDVALFFGALRYERREGRRSPVVYNSALLTDAGGRFLGWYDKVYLLLFGEYVPILGEYPDLMDKLLPNSSHMGRGARLIALELPHGDGPAARTLRLAPMICYEDILPVFTRRLVAAAAPVDVFVNITNDAWFGDTSEPYLHMALAVFRTVEHRVPLLRAVNTGTSVHVDATGRIRDQIHSYRKDAFVAEVRPVRMRTVYGVVGDWPAWLAVAWLLGVFLRRRLVNAPS